MPKLLRRFLVEFEHIRNSFLVVSRIHCKRTSSHSRRNFIFSTASLSSSASVHCAQCFRLLSANNFVRRHNQNPHTSTYDGPGADSKWWCATKSVFDLILVRRAPALGTGCARACVSASSRPSGTAPASRTLPSTPSPLPGCPRFFYFGHSATQATFRAPSNLYPLLPFFLEVVTACSIEQICAASGSVDAAGSTHFFVGE